MASSSLLSPELSGAHLKSLPAEVVSFCARAGLSSTLLEQMRLAFAALDLSISDLVNSPLARAWTYASTGAMELEVHRLSGQTERFTVYQWCTIRDVKELVHGRMGIPISELVLLSRGQELKGDKECLAAYRLTAQHNSLQVLQLEAREGVEEKEKDALQVFIRGAEGVPEGSLVSIRAGHTRRQTVLKLNEPYRFPARKETANPCKVDVWSLVGRARLQLISGEDRYTAHLEDATGLRIAKIELEAFDNSEQEKRRYREAEAAVPTRADVSERAQRSVQASRYFDEHGLYNFIQGLVQSLLALKPVDPFKYMLEQLQATAGARSRALKVSAGDSASSSAAGSE